MPKTPPDRSFQVTLTGPTTVRVTAKFMIVTERGDLCFTDNPHPYQDHNIIAHSVFRNGTWTRAEVAPEVP